MTSASCDSNDCLVDSCCVVWTLTHEMERLVTLPQLRALHREVINCCEIVGGTQLEASPTRGAFECFDASDGNLAAADAAVYAGMLVCRWAAFQEEFIDVRIGVHVGNLRKIVLPPLDTPRFFGPALHMARHLSESAPTGTSVHFLSETRNALRVFEDLPVCVSSRNEYFCSRFRCSVGNAYYIEPSMHGDFDNLALQLERGRKAAYSAAIALRNNGDGDDVCNMSVAEFEAFLKSKGVDTSLYGKGSSKSIEQFHNELVNERKSWLRETSTGLRRYLSIARIKVRANDATGLSHYLIMGLEIGENGVARNRDKCLGTWVKEDCSWEDEVANCFTDRLLVPIELQKQLFTTEACWFKEEELVSPSIPGLTTVYMTREVVIRVTMPPPKGVTVLGLPDLASFVTDTSVGRRFHWSWIPEGIGSMNNRHDQFSDFLLRYGVKVAEFEPGVLNDLLEEVHETKVSTLEVHGGEVLRRLSILKVWLSCDILSVPHVLVMVSKQRRGKVESLRDESAITMRLHRGQRWEDAVYDLLRDRLFIDYRRSLKDDVAIDHTSYRLLEETAYSSSYPGIKTVYLINEVTCRLRVDYPSLGLPQGDSFVVNRMMKNACGENHTVTTSFKWTPVANTMHRRLQSSRVTIEANSEVEPKRRVATPPVERFLDENCLGLAAIWSLMRGRTTNWERARNAARRIRDPDYNVIAFLEDCVAAFPELDLYLACGPESGTSSGRSSDDEYQRTVGALFAFYWLMRLHLDGAESFAFGVGGDDWAALSASSPSPRRSAKEITKRKQFLDSMNWAVFRDILTRAGFLCELDGGQGHDEEQTLAMLVLTAIHDVMKVPEFSPEVCKNLVGGDGFRGYAVGERIRDHDVALSYVMEHAPQMLPSFNGLPAHKKALVKFTQSDMEFNMGWLVQAEAPPGALFRKFKRITVEGKAAPCDITFYFVHWLTDLAGAEPCPLEGCEKFVLMFPQAVLTLFLRSFPHVSELSRKSETATLEGYVVWRWENANPSLGPAPTGEGSIARLRLAAMAPLHVMNILEAYDGLPEKTRQLLNHELAITGIVCQAYARDTANAGCGPAFLVYYAPALLSKNGEPTQAPQALSALAEVLRQARYWWPRTRDDADKVVTLRIDLLKQEFMSDIGQLDQGEFWALQRTSNVDAQVIRAKLFDKGAAQEHDWSVLRVLFFTQREDSEDLTMMSQMSPEAQDWLLRQTRRV